MGKIEDGWYAKVGKLYKGDSQAAPFKSPWEVFNFYFNRCKAVFVSNGKEILLIKPKYPIRGESKLL